MWQSNRAPQGRLLICDCDYDELFSISVVLRTFHRRPRLPLAKGVAFCDSTLLLPY
jgi:hypothetical protein